MKNYIFREFRQEYSRNRERKKKKGEYRKWESRYEESQDYETAESVEWKKHTVREYTADYGKVFDRDQRREILKWSLITLTGFFCAIFGIGIHMATITLVDFKNEIVTSYLDNGKWLHAFTWHCAMGLIFCSLSFLFVYFDPGALGSGVPEVKSYLNGVQLNNVVRLRTLFAKTGSVIFAVASGLFAGPEGPMVHVGAIIGASISRLHTEVILSGTHDWIFTALKNNSSSRDFVTYGAAAGIAAAFRAPIGGVLYILEEGASFWSTQLTWRAFFCSSITLLTLIVVDRALSIDGEDMTSNFSFGKFSELMLKGYPYYLIELALYCLMGCVGGVFGALFVHINSFLSRLRLRYKIGSDNRKRFAEILIITLLTAWMTFTVPLIWNVCSDRPTEEEMSSYTSDEQTLVSRLVQFDCPAKQYNQVASLFYVDSNTAIKLLFHFREHMAETTFDTGSLVVVFIPYFILACATCGVMASVGVFVSCLVSGAVLGRLVGHILRFYFAEVSDAGTYALVGAAAMIGGVCRNTISLTVMIVESTGNLQYVLPIMLSLLAAKHIGDILSTGLYDSLVIDNDLPMLPETLSHLGISNLCPVSEFMSKPVVYLKEIERVGDVIETLQTTTHNLFPIFSTQGGDLKGAIQRKTLLAMLQSAIFLVPLEGDNSTQEPTLCPVHMSQSAQLLHNDFDDSLTIESLRIPDDCLSYWIDCRQYLDPAPTLVLETASIEKAFKMFRTLGLRHLIVIDYRCKVSGIVTRKDLLPSELKYHKIKKSKLQSYFPIIDSFQPTQIPTDPSSRRSLSIEMNASRHHISPPPSEEYGLLPHSSEGSNSSRTAMPRERNSDEISLLSQRQQQLQQQGDEESGVVASEEGNPTAAAALRARKYGKVNLFFGFFN